VVPSATPFCWHTRPAPMLQTLLRLLCLLLMIGPLAGPARAASGIEAEALGAAQTALLEQLRMQARTLRLDQQPMWHKLLHMHRQPLTGRLRSLADDPDFFLAPDGRTNAQAELDATLAAFFDASPRHALDQSAQCRFPARWLWLDAQLQLSARGLAPDACTRYQDWLRGLDAERISLIFPAAYVNSPASMYGHTFLRVDARGAQGQPHPLLSYAISYAADGNEAEGLAFAFKGLFGLYPGVFSNAPYYLKIRDYTHLENRDIWEYELALTPAEIERLLAHAWELGSTRFDYYFFDENCAYHLLSLIDVARPDLDLSSAFTWWAIPVDTVRAVTRTPGLLRSRTYRPSNTTELGWRAARLPAPLTELAQRLGQGVAKAADLPATSTAPQRAETLELAERYMGYLAARGQISPDRLEAQRFDLLKARAELPLTPAITIAPPDTAPEDGHDTARLDLLHSQVDGTSTWQLDWRPAYHDLLDPEAGYQRGAQIQFMRFELARPQGGGLRLDRLTPVDIVSLTPSDGFLSGSSWKVRFGLERAAGMQPGQAGRLGAGVLGGPGRSWSDATGRWLAYAFVDNRVAYEPDRQQRWLAGSGPLLGLLWDPLPGWRLQFDGWRRWHAGSVAPESGARLQSRTRLSHQLNAVIDCAAEQRERRLRRCGAGLQRYW
ncbi:MAG: hypothetical protein RJA44_2585, partial [Pseudomonadota bacterium]